MQLSYLPTFSEFFVVGISWKNKIAIWQSFFLISLNVNTTKVRLKKCDPKSWRLLSKNFPVQLPWISSFFKKWIQIAFLQKEDHYDVSLLWLYLFLLLSGFSTTDSKWRKPSPYKEVIHWNSNLGLFGKRLLIGSICAS